MARKKIIPGRNYPTETELSRDYEGEMPEISLQLEEERQVTRKNIALDTLASTPPVKTLPEEGTTVL